MNAVVLSLDAELAWGYHDLAEVPEHVESARTSWSRLLALFDEYNVPATWAVVGHLFLDSCDGEHTSHVAPTDDWFDRDPSGVAERHPLWFADGLIEDISDAKASHEIGCHTFSHVEYGDERTTREVAVAETRASLEIADDVGYDLESFVFPRNNIGHRDVLAAYGFTCYRGTRPELWYDRGRFRSLAKAIDLTVSKTSPPLVTPEPDEYGLINIPASMFLFGYEGRVRTITEGIWEDPLIRSAKRGIDRAADADEGIFHLWMHPNNFTEERDFERLRVVLEHLAKRRDEARVQVLTMGEIANQLREADPATTRTPIGPR
ncbi:polysaccharide deacetylase family protein [Haladaptatus caseinilyticus]|uniref:polysaccharide deacetylase family protein n=1 Tax=Haladaptatus caseinilyticus TaxID=2993314 RepID=UPI00224A9D2F|nr:polysaccharide deacetylase family protein [Haladaptatus caseinilyticus]